MKIIFTGDWQASLHNLDRCEIIVQQILTILKNTSDVKFVIHCGDVKENFNPIDQRVTNFITSAIQRISQACYQFIYIRGNHDSITTQDGVPSCLPIIKTAGATIVVDNRWQKIPLGEGSFIWAVPYFRNMDLQKSEFKEAYEDANTNVGKGKKILVFHNEIEGCERTAYTKGQGLTLSDIGASHYATCVSGHIHRPQVFHNVRYAGSPFCMDWGECNENKSHLIFDIGKQFTISRVPSKVPGWFDPDAPNFQPPKDWKGTHVRRTITIDKDPAKELIEARKLLEPKYPGAILHLVPDFQKNIPLTDSVNIQGTDEEILTDYLSKATLPEGATPEQALIFLKQFLPSVGLFGVQGLKFKSVTGKNVLCFEDISLDLSRKGLTLVTGVNKDWAARDNSNGAGKSSLVSLPFLPLFGKTFKKQSHDEWARQSTKAPAFVELKLELPNGNEFRVQRGRRPGIFRVFEGSKEITMGDVNQTQDLIEHRTNLTWEVLTNSVYLGQREIGSVFGTEKDRKELFSRLLGLDRFLDAQEKIRKVGNRVQKCLDECDNELESTSRALEEASSGIELIVKSLAEIPHIDESSVKQRTNEISEKEFCVRKFTKEVEDLQPVLEANQKEFEGFLFKSTDAEAVQRELRKQIDSAQGVLSKPKCPTCGNKVFPGAIEDYVKDLRTKREAAGKEADKFEALGEKNRTLRATLIRRVQECNLEIRNAQKLLVNLRDENSKVLVQLDAQRRLEGIVEQKEARVKELTRQKKAQDKALEAYKDEKRFIDFCSNVVGRNGLPAYLCAIAAPQLNKAAARYSKIFAEGEIGIQFAISNGDIDLLITNIHGGNSVKDQSAGEMRMAGNIAAFSFRDVLVPHSLLILDEPGDGLDPVNAIAFAKGLNQVAERFESVMIITHNAHFLSALEPDHHIQVTKENGVSTIKEIS